MLRQLHALPREPVQVRGGDVALVKTDVSPTEIVRENKEDVRPRRLRGGAQGINDVVGGHIDMFYGGVAAGKAAIDGGSVRAIAVTGDTRSAALPNVPTFKESGVPEFDLVSWTVLLAPKGTPKDIVDIVRKETLAAIDDPATRAALSKQGVDRSPTQDVRAFLENERSKYGRAVRELGLKMGQ